MNKEPETLADFVRRTRLDKRFSLVDVARNSEGHISESYVSRIENGYILNVSPAKLIGLAKGLRVTEDELFTVARGQSLTTPSAVELQLLTAFRG